MTIHGKEICEFFFTVMESGAYVFFLEVSILLVWKKGFARILKMLKFYTN
jgi:hypothetical protein